MSTETPLRALKNESGLTVNDIAILAGATTRAVKFWLSGDRPTPQHVLTLMKLYLHFKKIDYDILSIVRSYESHPN